MSPTPHSSALQIVIELLVVLPILAVVAAIVWQGHRSGMARIRRAEAADEARILAGITMARHIGQLEVQPDGAQLVRIPAARTPMGG